jgi:hypothetical protein
MSSDKRTNQANQQRKDIQTNSLNTAPFVLDAKPQNLRITRKTKTTPQKKETNSNDDTRCAPPSIDFAAFRVNHDLQRIWP